jgi:hypothetical protein
MKNLGDWLYRHMAIRTSHGLQYILAVLDTLAPSPVYRPAPQRVSIPVSPRVSDVRLRSDVLTPWM